MELKKSTCADCKHFEPIPLQSGGFCKRYPPQPLYSQQGISSTHIPVAKNNTSCGEFALPAFNL